MSISKRCLQHTLLAVALAGISTTALAQTSNTVIYGSLDQYLNHMRSSSGAHGTHLEDGSTMRSRLGLRGSEDLGNGLAVKYQLEMGLNIDQGVVAQGGKLFDRQAWVGLANEWGELRLGRQNGAIFGIGSQMDHTGRTLGSVVNDFGAPARYDNTISYLSPRMAGLKLEVNYSMTDATTSSRQAIYQFGVDYLNGPWRAGYAGLLASPPSGAPYKRKVQHHNLYANYDYGQGKIYLAWVRSNNSLSNANGNNAGSILSGVGGVVAGTDADVNRFHNVWQISADYRVQDNLRVGALFGQIKESGSGNSDAVGGAISVYYDLSKRTTLLAGIQRLNNKNNAGFRFSGSAGLSSNFSGSDVNGRNLTGYHVGMVHRF